MVEFTFLLTKKRTEPGADLGFSRGAGWMGALGFSDFQKLQIQKIFQWRRRLQKVFRVSPQIWISQKSTVGLQGVESLRRKGVR